MKLEAQQKKMKLILHRRQTNLTMQKKVQNVQVRTVIEEVNLEEAHLLDKKISLQQSRLILNNKMGLK